MGPIEDEITASIVVESGCTAVTVSVFGVSSKRGGDKGLIRSSSSSTKEAGGEEDCDMRRKERIIKNVKRGGKKEKTVSRKETSLFSTKFRSHHNSDCRQILFADS